MPKRTAKFASAIAAALLASGYLTFASSDTADAAETCLSAPNAVAPDGGHWYYRIDRSTKRHCWYVRDDKRSPGEPQVLSPAASAVSSPKRITTPPALANAHDELPPPLPRVGQDTRPVTGDTAIPEQPASIPDANSRRPAVASPWPDPSSAPSNGAMSTASTPLANGAAASPPSNPVLAPAPLVGTAVASVAEDSPPTKNSISIPKVLLVIAGALSVVSVMGGFGFRGWKRTGHGIRTDWDAGRDSIAIDRRPPPIYPNTGRRMHDSRATDDPSRRIAQMMARLTRNAPS